MHPSPRLNTTANRRFFPKITTEYRFHPIHRQSTCHFHLTTAPTRRSSLKTIFSNSDRTDCTGTCMRHWYEKLAVTGMVIHVCCALPSRSLSSWLPVTPSSPRLVPSLTRLPASLTCGGAVARDHRDIGLVIAAFGARMSLALEPNPLRYYYKMLFAI